MKIVRNLVSQTWTIIDLEILAFALSYKRLIHIGNIVLFSILKVDAIL
jgi:hypothetical protein